MSADYRGIGFRGCAEIIGVEDNGLHGATVRRQRLPLLPAKYVMGSVGDASQMARGGGNSALTFSLGRAILDMP
jgi:hypothetical protein